MITSAWCLELGLAALTKAPIEPIGTCRLEYLTWKTAFLLSITSRHRTPEMHTSCYKPSYLWFSNAGLTLFIRLGFLPKVYTRPMCLSPSLCQQCTTRQMVRYKNSVSAGHLMNM